jgi:YaiO family outer membrane protein
LRFWREEYERILQDEPSHVEALSGLGDVLLWSGHQEQAIPYYERVVAATGDAQVAARLQSLKAASVSAAAVVPPSDPLANHQANPMAIDGTQALERGGRLETMRQYADAIAVYREGLQQTPGHDEIRTALARVLSWQGAYAEATTLYREVLARHPQDQEIRVALAQVLSWQQQFDEARSLYQAVLQAEPAQVDARRGLAEVAHWQGHRSEALQRYEVLLAETHDPAIEQQIRAVKSELLVSPRAAVGQGLTGLRLPYRDYAKIGYGHYSYTKNQPDERDLLFEIAKPFGNQTLVVRAEPINRFGSHDTPLSAELYSPLWQRAWGYVAAQGTINPHFSPNYSFVGEVAQGLGGLHPSLAPFEVSFGYRRLNYKHDDIDLLMPGLTIFLPFNLWLTEKVYMIPNTGAVTLASQLTWRPTERVQLFASGSFGTSGERIVAAQDFTRVGSRTIQGGVTFPINERFSAETSGYYEDRGFLYVRRGGNFNLIYHW